jgi:hypothetical protein
MRLLKMLHEIVVVQFDDPREDYDMDFGHLQHFLAPVRYRLTLLPDNSPCPLLN